ncbi:PadR family transcriptional regulator [Streptomyces sp. ODS28]|uniref:PadR family transcriptional regulator n=1 Tax=Streptomyces sp. ODS28 TaxID=3136688 RepID=UPI0031ED63B3
MPPVFAHGRLRLYLLKLLDEAPRHGYEVIRLLEERFQGLYAPSAGTVYPRLAKLEAEGLVRHTTERGRKVYALTDAGRAEVADRQGELAELEVEIRESLAALAEGIREDVSGSAQDLRREVREQAERTRADARGAAGAAKYGDWDSWRQAKEDVRRAGEGWKEQAKRAKKEAQQAKRQAKEAESRAEAAEEVRRIARQVQDQVQTRAKSGDWPGAVRDGMSELARGMGQLGRITGYTTPWPPHVQPDPAGAAGAETDTEPDDTPPSEDPVRDLERLLDTFRDEIRDTARDNGVTDAQLREARRHLSTASAHIAALLRSE